MLQSFSFFTTPAVDLWHSLTLSVCRWVAVWPECEQALAYVRLGLDLPSRHLTTTAVKCNSNGADMLPRRLVYCSPRVCTRHFLHLSQNPKERRPANMPEWTMRNSQRGFREVGGGIEENQKGRRKDVSAGAALLGIEFLLTYLTPSIFMFL